MLCRALSCTLILSLGPPSPLSPGLHNIYHSQPPRLVPIREMVESISVTLKTTAKARAG